jgi:hypothetical protein
VAVNQELCGDDSGPSNVVVVDADPYPLPSPGVPDIYEQQELFPITRLTYGTTQTVTSNLAGLLGTTSSRPPLRAPSMVCSCSVEA